MLLKTNLYFFNEARYRARHFPHFLIFLLFLFYYFVKIMFGQLPPFTTITGGSSTKSTLFGECAALHVSPLFVFILVFFQILFDQLSPFPLFNDYRWNFLEIFNIVEMHGVTRSELWGYSAKNAAH